MLSRIDSEIRLCEKELLHYNLGMAPSASRFNDRVTSGVEGRKDFLVGPALIRVRGDQAFATLNNVEYVYDHNESLDWNKPVTWAYMSNPDIFTAACNDVVDSDPDDTYFVSTENLRMVVTQPMGFTFTLKVNSIELVVESQYIQYERISLKDIYVRFVLK